MAWISLSRLRSGLEVSKSSHIRMGWTSRNVGLGRTFITGHKPIRKCGHFASSAKTVSTLLPALPKRQRPTHLLSADFWVDTVFSGIVAATVDLRDQLKEWVQAIG